MTIYLDCNATTPLDPEVKKIMLHYFSEEYGNAGSRTHEFGSRAKQAVQRAREQIAKIVNSDRSEVIFTSGATESNNLALLGLVSHGKETEKKHIISTQIEHKAILEPLEAMAQRGFDITLVPPNSKGWVEPEAIQQTLRDDTLLVSVMHVNNETGVVQPIAQMAELLEQHPAYFHTDAAQGFGKDIKSLQHPRIDLISISGHKLYGPKGIGALIARRRKYERPPLRPLIYGGGQEHGLRPGTLPVPLIVGLGKAAELALEYHENRARKCIAFRENLLSALDELNVSINSDLDYTLPHVLNFSIPGLDSEAVMLILKETIAVSNGSACTSQSYEASHVLQAMGLSEDIISGALRFSWCHMTEEPDWKSIVSTIQSLT